VGYIDEIYVVSEADTLQKCKELIENKKLHNELYNKVKAVIVGGESRQKSSFNGVKYVDENTNSEIVTIHDVARPFTSVETINANIEAEPDEAYLTTFQNVVSLKEKNDISGTLKIFFDTAEKITDKNRYLMIGLSHLISTQMEISKVENLMSLLKYSELKALQSQINPHFLFNVLNTMTSLIRTNPEKAREVTIDLSNYLRYNLDNNVKSVELIKELNQVDTYIKIEKVRFGDKLNILYDVDESLYNFQIPSLIIQPLVENSIKHGILKKRDNGCVKIIIKKIDKDIEITIEDDGVGIEQSIIDNLDKQIKENIGLKNVHQRLKLLYGEGLNIKKLEQGTRIKFKILGGVKYD